MNCPVCDRDLAPTLSICPACGAMMNDTVREELQPKVIALRDRPLMMQIADDAASVAIDRDELTHQQPLKAAANMGSAGMMASVPAATMSVGAANPRPQMGATYQGTTAERASSTSFTDRRPSVPDHKPEPQRPVETGALRSANTSPTLVGFQNRNTSEPDWKIQLRSAVQKRRGISNDTETSSPDVASAARCKTAATSTVRSKPEVDLDSIKATAAADPRVAKALERIERSKAKFTAETIHKTPSPPLKFRPAAFDTHVSNDRMQPTSPSSRLDSLPVIKKLSGTAMPTNGVAASQPQANVHRLFPEPDTNRLPEIDAIEKAPAKKDPIRLAPIDDLSEIDPLSRTFEPVPMTEERIVIEATEQEDDEYFADDTDDLAPISMRLGAGAFDMIFATAGAGLALLPFILIGLDVSTTFGIAVAVLMFGVTTFVYQTIGLAFFERTIGMRLFGLELVDAAENEPPTLKQSAISSAVFVGSLFTLGLGFATVAINPERRALHDLVSKTILVKEF